MHRDSLIFPLKSTQRALHVRFRGLQGRAGLVLSFNKYLRDFKAKPLSSFTDDKIGVLTIVAYVPRTIEKARGFLDKDTFSPFL
jgi:hypothetical protein